MKYFAIIDDEQRGPFELGQLAEAGVTPDTYVWCKDMPDWAQAREVADICRHFRNRIFDINHPALAGGAGKEEKKNDTQEKPGREEDLGNVPMRFRYPISKADPEDVDFGSFNAQPDLSQPPRTWYPFPMVLSVLFFFPLGLLAISQARKSRKAWKEGKAAEAYEFARRGKMAAGMGFSFGLILVAGFLPLLFR